MKTLAKRFAIGAMAAMIALSAVSAQAAVSDAPDSTIASSAVSQINSDTATYHSMGYYGDNYWLYEEIKDSPVIINGYSGNVYFELAGLPIQLTYNSLRDRNVGYGPNFMSDSHNRLISREDGSYLYYESTGLETHFTYDAGRDELVDERNWNLRPGSSSYMEGYMNSRPRFVFDFQGNLIQQYYREQNDVYVRVKSIQRDQYGNLENTQYYGGRTVNYAYYPAPAGEMPMIKSLTEDSDSYTMIYNDQGNLLRVENASGDTYLELEYDETGKRITRIGGTVIEYDEQGRAANVKTYNSNGILSENTTFDYGATSTTITKADGSTEIVKFNPDGSWRQ